jgi:hypothetical protein
MTTRLCIDCKYSDASLKCNRPLTDHISPVTGSLDQLVNTWCVKERSSTHTLFRTRERCGPDGIFFEKADHRIVSESKPSIITHILKSLVS